MDPRLQFTGRYNKDVSVDGLRVKLARRKSLTQKENRHNEFGKSRGLRLADPNTSVFKSLRTVEELSETSLAQGHDSSVVLHLGETRDLERNKQRYDMLQRYKEEKLLRKLKEQREKAQKGVFRCGVYKHDDNVPSLPSTKHTGKPKDKQAPPTTRVTRSAMKNEAPPPRNTRRQPITAGAGNVGSKASEAATRGHGQSQAIKTADKENHGVPPVRITRATAARALPRNTNVAVIKPQKRNQKDPNPQDPEVASRIPVQEDQADEASEPMKSDSAMEPPRERIPSFAPENFTFQPLDGLCSYKLQPTTPTTDRPRSFTWSPPHAPCDAMQEAPQDPIQVCEAQPPSCNEVTSPTWPPTTETAEECDVQTPAVEPQHDVPYFRAALKAEIQRLTLLCTQWDERIGIEMPDEAKDLIRTTVGQTRLLVAERFKQFEGLVDNCEFKRGEKETTCTDLDGFWDMVYFQIEDVIKKFANLGKLEENLWQQSSTVQPNKAVKKRIAPVVKANRGEEARAAARSRLAAIKAAMKKGKVSEETPEAADQTPPADAVVFDAGFFRVESPAKRPSGVKPKCGSPQTSALCKSNTGTPRAAPTIGSVDGSRLTRTPGIKSPVGTTLFGDREEDGLTELESCEQSTRLAAKESELAKEENLVKLLVPPEECDLSFGSPKSFELVTHSHGETRIHSHILAAGEIEDEVFMSNAEEMEQQTHGNAPVPEDVQPPGHPLDFLGSCRPPDMTPLTPLRFDAVAASSDLMVFSPLGE